MTRRFTTVAAAYVAACCLAIVIIVIHGDGPHPRIVALYPPNGDRYFPGGAVQITFSQAMDQASVERALQVSPGSQGQGSWFGNTLNLQPVGDWRQNVTYHVMLTGSVVDDQGRPLRTPVSFWFRAHSIKHLVVCTVRGVRNVCERSGGTLRPLTTSPAPIQTYALSPDASLLTFTRADSSGLPHLFLMSVDTVGVQQLTRGSVYADSAPSWPDGDSSDIVYKRQQVIRVNGKLHLGKPHLWDIQIDGSENAPF